MPEEEYNFTLDENQIIFREILNVTNLGRICHSTDIMSVGIQAWNSNVDNYYHGSHMLIPVCIRHLDQSFFTDLKQILKKYQKKWAEYSKTEQDNDLRKEKAMRLTLAYSDAKLAAIIKQLDRRGIYNEKSVHTIPNSSRRTEDTTML